MSQDAEGLADEVLVLLTRLDGSLRARIRLLTGMTDAELDAVGGVDEVSGAFMDIDPDDYRLTDPTEGMTEAEMAVYYDRTHDLSGFMSEEDEAAEINQGEADLLAAIKEARAHPERGMSRPPRRESLDAFLGSVPLVRGSDGRWREIKDIQDRIFTEDAVLLKRLADIGDIQDIENKEIE